MRDLEPAFNQKGNKCAVFKSLEREASGETDPYFIVAVDLCGNVDQGRLLKTLLREAPWLTVANVMAKQVLTHDRITGGSHRPRHSPLFLARRCRSSDSSWPSSLVAHSNSGRATRA